MSLRSPLPMCPACEDRDHDNCGADLDQDEHLPCACSCRPMWDDDAMEDAR